MSEKVSKWRRSFRFKKKKKVEVEEKDNSNGSISSRERQEASGTTCQVLGEGQRSQAKAEKERKAVSGSSTSRGGGIGVMKRLFNKIGKGRHKEKHEKEVSERGESKQCSSTPCNNREENQEKHKLSSTCTTYSPAGGGRWQPKSQIPQLVSRGPARGRTPSPTHRKTKATPTETNPIPSPGNQTQPTNERSNRVTMDTTNGRGGGGPPNKPQQDKSKVVCSKSDVSASSPSPRQSRRSQFENHMASRSHPHQLSHPKLSEDVCASTGFRNGISITGDKKNDRKEELNSQTSPRVAPPPLPLQQRTLGGTGRWSCDNEAINRKKGSPGWRPKVEKEGSGSTTVKAPDTSVTKAAQVEDLGLKLIGPVTENDHRSPGSEDQCQPKSKDQNQKETPSELPSAFRSLLEAPLPARPWHPGNKSPINRSPSFTRSQRPISKPTVYPGTPTVTSSTGSHPLSSTSSSSSPTPSATTTPTTATTPSSVIHYHVTIQNSEGLGINVEDNSSPSQPQCKAIDTSEAAIGEDIVPRTVYTSDGKELKRLSWIEVAPGTEDQTSRTVVSPEKTEISMDESEEKKNEPVIDIGVISLAITPVSDTPQRNSANNSYVNMDAVSKYSNQAALKSYSKEGVEREGGRTGKNNDNTESGTLDASCNNKKKELRHVTAFPWHNDYASRAGVRSRETNEVLATSSEVKPSTHESRSRQEDLVVGTGPSFNDAKAGAVTSNKSSEIKKKTKSQHTTSPVTTPKRPNFKPGEKKPGIEPKAESRRRRRRECSPDKSLTVSHGVNKRENSERERDSRKENRAETIVIDCKPRKEVGDNGAGAMTCKSKLVDCESQTDAVNETGGNPKDQELCADCRKLRSERKTSGCGHAIPADIVSRRRAEFGRLLSSISRENSNDNITAMRVGPHTAYYRHAESQTFDSATSYPSNDTSTCTERESRPIGRVEPTIRRSASMHAFQGSRPDRPWRRSALHRHWSFSSADSSDAVSMATDHDGTSSLVDWDVSSIDTDLLTMETDRTLMETERTLREVEMSILESRRASRALQRARMELDSSRGLARERGVSLDRNMMGNSREARREPQIIATSNSSRLSDMTRPLLGERVPTPIIASSTRRQTAVDKLTRIRGNLIRVPGVLILGLREDKINVTMSPDRPSFEPIYRFMRENDVNMTEYECSVLSHRYRNNGVSSRLGLVRQQPIMSPVMVR